MLFTKIGVRENNYIMKHFMIHIEEINGKEEDKKVYIINQYQKEKIDKIVEEDHDDNSSIEEK